MRAEAIEGIVFIDPHVPKAEGAKQTEDDDYPAEHVLNYSHSTCGVVLLLRLATCLGDR